MKPRAHLVSELSPYLPLTTAAEEEAVFPLSECVNNISESGCQEIESLH